MTFAMSNEQKNDYTHFNNETQNIEYLIQLQAETNIFSIIKYAALCFCFFFVLQDITFRFRNIEKRLALKELQLQDPIM